MIDLVFFAAVTCLVILLMVIVILAVHRAVDWIRSLFWNHPDGWEDRPEQWDGNYEEDA